MTDLTRDEYQKTGTCAICGSDYDHYGNNPEPLLTNEQRVCDRCNQLVIQVRLGAKADIMTHDGKHIVR